MGNDKSPGPLYGIYQYTHRPFGAFVLADVWALAIGSGRRLARYCEASRGSEGMGTVLSRLHGPIHQRWVAPEDVRHFVHPGRQRKKTRRERE
jgi:hypothetical protein